MSLAKKSDKNAVKIAELEAKCREYQDMLKRLQAEFENYQKRQEQQNLQSMRFSCASFLAGMLPVLDSFDTAMKDDRAKPFLEPLYSQMAKTLQGMGLSAMETEGKHFDPNLHEVMLKEHNPVLDDGLITLEIQKGYMLHDKVLRHAKVKVNRNDKEDNGQKGDPEPGK